MKFEKIKKTGINLVPDVKNPTPDYYCTWQTQLYASSDGKPKGQRAIICEKSLFDKEKPYGWAYFHEKARRDLYIIMDDSWDVPADDDDRKYYGSLILDKGKFPEATENSATNAESLKKLTDRILSLGWKGLGGWVCAEESEVCENFNNKEEYWTHRVKECAESGFSYWKVDWGKSAGDAEFRRMLTDLAKKYAPKLVVEHSMIKDIIPYSDTYRTYDVPAIMSIPMTMEKIAEFSDVEKAKEGFLGLINCEDEAYIAAAGGFCMGIMRQPYVGALPDGRADMSFPCIHRNIKSKMAEVVRAARWHRIAPAFSADKTETEIDCNNLSDTWLFEKRHEEMEAWWFNMPAVKECLEGELLTKKAPARIARRTSLPEVTPNENGLVPYVVSSLNPNGVYSVVTCGRTLGRDYFIPKCDVRVNAENADTIGVFGEYKTLEISFSYSLDGKRVYAQDIASEEAFDITEEVCVEENKLIINGALIWSIGTMAQDENDTSEPGLMIKIK